jgi:RNA polymerase sigma-70 factor, ECF subfamily
MCSIQQFSEWVFGFFADYYVKIGEDHALVGSPPMPDPKRYDEFSALVRLHMRQVLAYINSLVLNWNDADDLFQETCVVLWQKFDEFRPGTNFLAWALRIADRKVMKFQTDRSRRAAFTASLRDALQSDFADRNSEDAEANLTALSGCMGRLSQNDQQMAKLCYIEGISIRQLADAMGRPLKSVQNSLYRIRAWLLDCIRRELNKTEISVHPQHRSLQEEDGT